MTGAVHFVCTYHVYAGHQQWRSCGAVFGSLDALIVHRETAHDTPRRRRPTPPSRQPAAGQRRGDATLRYSTLLEGRVGGYGKR